MKKLCFLLTFFVLGAAIADAPRRAAFDLGSGAFRLKVAGVEIPTPERKMKVAGAEDLAKSKDGKFSVEYEKKAAEVLKTLAALAKKSGATELVGVATGVFREAKNAKALVRRLQKETGIQLHIISPKQESILGFLGGAAAVDLEKKKIVVWDIGGSTMQFSSLDAKGEVKFVSLTTAAVGYKNAIISEIQKKNPKEVTSPNPIQASEVEPALEIAQKLAKDIPKSIRERLAKRDTKVVGIGGVHYYSIGKQLGGAKEFTREQVRGLIDKRVAAKSTDDDLRAMGPTDYPETDVSNPLLVLGLMEALNIPSVKVVNVDNTDGLLVAPKSFFKN